jgi:hypothetical protein
MYRQLKLDDLCETKFSTMQTYQPVFQPSFRTIIKKQSFVTRFFDWCAGQEQNRFGWLAVILAIHGCVLAPITLFMVFAGGNNIALWCMTMGAMAISLVSNLAAMPTKITIPVFVLSVLIDIAVMAICVNAMMGN